MTNLRSIRIALTLATVLLMSNTAIAGNKEFCAATTAQFYNAMQYWTTSSDNNVIVDLVQGTYLLTETTANYQQPDGAGGGTGNSPQGGHGSAALILRGGYQSTANPCDARSVSAANTILDGQYNSNFFIFGNGNLTIDGVTIQSMSFPPTVFGDGVQIDSLGNGVSISNAIFRNITGATNTDSAGVRIFFSGAGASITDSLFYNIAGCSNPTIAPNCAALGIEGFSTANAEIISTTIASNSQFGLSLMGDVHLAASDDIVWGNGSGDIYLVGSRDNTASFSYSDFNSVSNNGTFTQGSGNVNIDPLFVNSNPTSASANFMLKTTPTLSPLIDTGATAATIALINGYSYPDRDIIGDPRVVGSRVDIGAYESSYNDLHNLVVTSTSDSGAGSLRAAIITANANPGASNITFAIPGGCGQIIVLSSALPDLNYPINIDGGSQSGSVPNDQYGAFDGTFCVYLTTASSSVAYGFEASASTSQLQVSGLAFAGFSDAAIRLEGGGNHAIGGNLFTGGVILPFNHDAIRVTGSTTSALIGGYGNATTNVIINGTGVGVHIDSTAGNVIVARNLIGIAVDGTSAAGNDTGILVAAPGNIIENNFIGNNTHTGVTFAGAAAAANIVRSNDIGQNENGASEPNGQAGVLLQAEANDNSIGGLSAAENLSSNSIAYNNGPGVWVSPSAGIGNSVIANNIYDNGGTSFNNGLALDLGNVGPDANHEPPATSGPDDFQNYPVIVSNITTAQGQIVTGTLDARASQSYRLDFFFAAGAPTGYAGRGEGGDYYGYLIVTTDATGHCAFTATLAPENDFWLSATATSLAGSFLVPQNTSEIGNAVKSLPDEIFKNGFDPAGP